MKTVVHLTRIRPVQRTIGLRHRPLGSPKDRMLRPLAMALALLALGALSALSLLSGSGRVVPQAVGAGAAVSAEVQAGNGN